MRKVFIALAVALLLSSHAGVARANLVINGGFETNNFNGWTTASEVGIGSNAGDAHSGSYSAMWQNSYPGHLSQTFTTVVDQSYTVDFFASPGAGWPGDGSFFSVMFGNTTLLDIRDLTDPDNWSVNYQHFTFNVTGTGNDTLKFSFYSAESEGWLDDVSVNPVPIPGAIWLLGSGLMGFVGFRKRLTV